MKLAIVLTFLLAAATSAVDELPPECLPTNETEDTPYCIATGETCTADEEGCCEGLVCSGFGFYKRCQEPPVCLGQWMDCSDGTACCDNYKCIIRDTGALECDEETIGTRTVDIGNLLDNSTDAPTAAPVPPNLNTTFPEDGSAVEYDVACSSGDPHIRTFDGLKYDCQAEGEMILVKSWVTRREVQATYTHMTSKKAISLGRGVAVQDEGDTPLVELSAAMGSDVPSNDYGEECGILFFVNHEQKDLKLGYEDDDVIVEEDRHLRFVIRYKKTGMEVTATYRKCRFNICVNLPLTDPVYGVLGTANSVSSDEWMLEDKSIMPVPEDKSDKLKFPGYQFCAGHMCLRDESKSLFTHAEPTFDFDYYNKCDLPYGDTFEEYLENIPQWVLDVCGHDLACIIDVRNGDEEDARLLRMARLEYGAICNPSGGECEDSPCCGDSQCVDFGGNAGKECDGDLTCSPDMGNCADLPCCDGHICVELDDGSKQCRKDLLCQEDWMSCGDGKDCCDGLVCMFNHQKQVNQCRKLPSCMPKLDDCSIVPCCGDLKCMDTAEGGKQCQEIPGCWKHQWKDCSVTPCCSHLTCVEHNGGNFCRKLPRCVKTGQSCKYVGCCNEKGPADCVDVIDGSGNTDKQCRLKPGEVEVRVFSDIDGDGRADSGEPGIEGVKLVIVEELETGRPAFTDPVVTNGEGIATFLNIPKAKKFRVQVLEAPAGGVPTQKNRGGDTTDSDLNPGGIYTDIFYQSGIVYRNVQLGYKMPRSVKIHVFDDADGDGRQDSDETGIEGVSIRIVNEDGTDFTDSSFGGNAHTEQTTDTEGYVTFTNVPQNVNLRAKVTKPPIGAVPTNRNVGGDTIDSDLRADLTTDIFVVSAGSGAHTTTDVGFRMPESVIVKVWDDADRDGRQDSGEPGIEGVKLILVHEDRTTQLPDQDNGGNAHTTLTTGADGKVTFTKVPQQVNLRVKVVERPEGSIPTKKNVGSDTIDSDLNSDFTTDLFMIPAGGSYTHTDIGLWLAGSMVIRVWDDLDEDGRQDSNELGISGVELRMITGEGEVLPETGGNCHLPQETNADGKAVFTGIPQGWEVRAQVLNAPPGAIPAAKNVGGDTIDSDLHSDGNYTDKFTMGGVGDFTVLDIGYKMPDSVKVRVWDDADQDGRQDGNEVGISGVEMCLVYADTLQRLTQLDGLSAHEAITTDANGDATFTGVPKGVDLRVKVLNKPPGAIPTRKDVGGDTIDSDLKTDSTTNSFNLASFRGGVYTSVDLGYQTPDNVVIRVWDDVDGDGRQDSGEPGIPGVVLKLVNSGDYSDIVADIPGSTASSEITTDESGFARFVKVPKGASIRAFVVNKPDGSIITRRNVGGDTTDSDLQSSGYSDSFSMASFSGTELGSLDLGLKMPKDLKVKVWADLDADGRQDSNEAGIEGVELILVNEDRTAIDNIGGGSDAHLPAFTDADGFAYFTKLPRDREMRVHVVNAPPGTKPTSRNVGSDTNDSDLNTDMYTDKFSMGSFNGAGAEGKMDIGFKMPVTVLFRVWKDSDGDGRQDSNEVGFEGVPCRLVHKDSPFPPFEDQGDGGTAHMTLNTDAEGRVRFTKVPQGVELRVQVLEFPTGYVPTKMNVGNDQVDNDLWPGGRSVEFTVPAKANGVYDYRDGGFKLA